MTVEHKFNIGDIVTVNKKDTHLIRMDLYEGKSFTIKKININYYSNRISPDIEYINENNKFVSEQALTLKQRGNNTDVITTKFEVGNKVKIIKNNSPLHWKLQKEVGDTFQIDQINIRYPLDKVGIEYSEGYGISGRWCPESKLVLVKKKS